MSFEIPIAFVDQFSANIQHLSQQKGSVLAPLVDVETIKGEQAFFEQIAAVEARERLTRHGDSPLISTPHARRRVTQTDYEWGDMIDNQDKLRMLIDPSSDYIKAANMAFGRTKDDIIIDAALGTAYTGHRGATAVALPAGQIVPVGTTGLSLAKLISAKSLFGKNEVDTSSGLNIVVSQQQIDDLLNEDEVVNADYATVKALVCGEINTFMGFTFHRTERLPLATATDVRSCFAFVRDGIKLGVGQDIKAEVAKRADKGFNWYAYVCMSLGCTRMEEVKVVQIECDESP